MKRYLITGGAGFIGSHLAKMLIRDGTQVTVIDDLSTGASSNIESLIDHPAFSFHEGSAADERTMESLVKDADIVFHLAASVGVQHIMDKLVASIENNVKGTEVVLALCDKYQKRVLLTSTSEVYGSRCDKPFHEEDDLRMGSTLKTRWSYACSKALDEYLAFAYWRERGLRATVVRLFNTVGAGQTGQYGMVIPRFVEQALAGKSLTVFGDGQQSRCFCDVRDVVQALQQLVAVDTSIGEVYNVGATEEVTMLDLAHEVIAATGSSSAVVKIPYQDAYAAGFDDIDRRVPNINKLQTVTGWTPTITRAEIIESVAAWLREEQMQPASRV